MCGTTEIHGRPIDSSSEKLSVSDETNRTKLDPATPRCIAVAERGIRTGADMAEFMSLAMGDIVSNRLTPSKGNAAINAAGKLLKVVELRFKYGKPMGDSDLQDVILVPSPEAIA